MWFLRTLSIELEADGYKPVRFNILDKQCADAHATIDLGIIKLVPTDAPVVAQIIRSTDQDGKVRLSVILHNRRKHKVFLRNLTLSAVHPLGGSICALDGDTFHQYRLSSKMIVSAGTTSRSVTGSFEDTADSPSFSTQWKGVFESETCVDPHHRITFQMPLSIVLPPEEYTSVKLILPSQFVGTGRYPETLTSSRLQAFDFIFVSDDTDAPQIKATYAQTAN